MSVNIVYEPINQKKDFSCGLYSNLSALEKIYGACPIILNGGDIPKLEAMFAASGDKFYEQVINAVLKYDKIRIYGEW